MMPGRLSVQRSSAPGRATRTLGRILIPRPTLGRLVRVIRWPAVRLPLALGNNGFHCG